MIRKKLISRLNFCSKDVFFLGLTLTLGLIAVWSYFNLDQQVFPLLCQKPLNWGGTFWLKAFSCLGKAWLLIWLLLMWSLSTGRQKPVLVALLALIIISLVVIPLKVSVKRPRPREVIKTNSNIEGQYEPDYHLSFPSGDAASAFAVATVVISFVTWPCACLLLAACAGVALLRVTAMAHNPSDVFAGAAIGSFAGWLAVQIDRRWLPLEPPRFNLTRGVTILAIILIPLLLGLSEGIGKLLIFSETYGLLAILLFLALKASEYLKKINATTKLANSERFCCILNWLRKRRTLALRIAFPIMIAENIIDGEKPHELGFPDISAMAIIGLVLILVGAFIRVWARGHFEKGRLFTTGPYALVRHPLYLGSFLVVIGILFQLNDGFNWVVLLSLFVVFYGAAVIYEERSLERRFGKQWQLYKAKTPAIIPRLWNWRPTGQTRKWHWKTYLSTSEPIVTLMLLCVPLIIELIEELVFEGMLGI
jgi:protein-S-isoprenylcysteine O-methyltransferase Ste14/membrane-associated phospholipid phosphatase